MIYNLFPKNNHGFFACELAPKTILFLIIKKIHFVFVLAFGARRAKKQFFLNFYKYKSIKNKGVAKIKLRFLLDFECQF